MDFLQLPLGRLSALRLRAIQSLTMPPIMMSQKEH